MEINLPMGRHVVVVPCMGDVGCQRVAHYCRGRSRPWEAPPIVTACAVTTGITVLRLRLADHEFGDRDMRWWIAFLDGIVDAPALEDLRLDLAVREDSDYDPDTVRFSDDSVIALVDRCLRRYGRLRRLHLTLDGSELGADAIDAIAALILTDLHLGLRHVRMDDEMDACALGRLVARFGGDRLSLDLQGCRLEDEHLSETVDVIVAAGRPPHRRLTVDFSYNEIRDIAPLVELFRCGGERVTLDLRGSLSAVSMQTLRDRCCDEQHRLL